MLRRPTPHGERLVRLGRQTRLLYDEASAALGAVATVELPVAVNADSLATWFRDVLATAAEWAYVVDVVPGARTVVVVVAPGTDLAALRRAVLALDTDPVAALDGPLVEIPVVYEGPDLAEVAELTGLGVEGVVAAHTGTPWRVGFGGFAPGFAYLIEGDPRLQVPRRSEPRTAVPAGSVALAGEFSAVYPRQSPGGWQIIGHTDAVLWDIDRPDPALLTQGMWIRFRAA